MKKLVQLVSFEGSCFSDTTHESLLREQSRKGDVSLLRYKYLPKSSTRDQGIRLPITQSLDARVG
jgi:hypothetical protein